MAHVPTLQWVVHLAARSMHDIKIDEQEQAP